MIMSQQKYPVGIETFSNIIEDGYAYVDKTEIIYRLTQAGKFFFLSRPRRFGKSLMISTLEAYFEGRKELFEGLWLGNAEGVDWTPRPVLRLNFVNTKPTVQGLNDTLDGQLKDWERKYNITPDNTDFGRRFFKVIETAAEVSGQKVAVLIDEYDKVLLNTMHEPELHEEMKQILKPVYGTLKGADRYIEFAILTGVSRFSKLSIFSDLNNLNDISFDDQFCSICGVTEDELRTYFAPGVESFAAARNTDFEGMMQILKENYDGYHFSEICPDIYNPFSLINALASKKILHRWFESGTPTFLLKRISHSDEELKDFLSPVVSARALTNTSITDTNLIHILYQTGYLTIKSYDEEEEEYTLGLPNKEVAVGVYENLLPFYTGKDVIANDNVLRKLRKQVNKGDAEGFVKTLQSFMAGIPRHLSEGKHEIYYENNLYIIFRLLGFDIRTEEETSCGRIDAVLKTPQYIYVIELKLNGTAEEAIEQIRSKQYDLPFEIDDRKIIRIGISFSKESRTIDRWIIE